ncbi:MAG: glycosyltransferase family A protein [Nitrososphaerales archaeon]|jgi:hypothetical protein
MSSPEKRVLAIIASYEPAQRTRLSLESQSLPPARIVVADKIFHDRHVGIRVSKAINTALDGLDMTEFDWLLRVDGDTLLPPDWIEKASALGADVVGTGGVLLVRMSAFKAVGYRFPVLEAEDSMLILKLMSLGFKRVPYTEPISLRGMMRGTDSSMLTFFRNGIWRWKMGYEPIHAVYISVAASAHHRNLRFLFQIFGYFFAMLSRPKKWDIDLARFVFDRQLRTDREKMRRLLRR